jgi:hypothetical protein
MKPTRPVWWWRHRRAARLFSSRRRLARRLDGAVHATHFASVGTVLPRWFAVGVVAARWAASWSRRLVLAPAPVTGHQYVRDRSSRL